MSEDLSEDIPQVIEWNYGENIAVWCNECGTVFTLESDVAEFVGGTCQNCGERLNVVKRSD